MFKNFTIYLNEIREAINSIERFVEGMTFEDFKSDDKTSSAVIRKLEIIGEATKKIPENIRKKHSQIPWKEISGMRDKLIHAYSKVDLKLVWMAIKQRIPELKSFIQKIMTEN